MWPWRQDGGIGEPLQAQDEYPSARRPRRRRDPGGKHAAAGDDTQPAWHFCLIFHCFFRNADSAVATAQDFSA
jgi:hypothetical protein